MTALSLSTRILTRRFSSFLYAGVNDFLESSYVYRSKSNNPKTNQLYSDRLIDRLEWLSPKAPGKESGTEKGSWSSTVAAPAAPTTTSGKREGVRAPFPPYSLSTLLPPMCTTLRRVALASHHRRLPGLLRLARGWRWRRSSTDNGWRRMSLTSRSATVGPLTSRKEEQAVQAPASDLR
jgi:hypothetical protein